MKRDDVYAVSVIALVALGLLGAGVLVTVKQTTRSACLRSGYPSYAVDWTLGRFCIKRVDQTDVVVPFSERQ